ncbi:hypothetical protein H2201_006440 [Coniosporium apollinis]|uniref:Uncharacterized protein n=1 Tax=Coniosporium apollinis TaxID=61459 RepID=A0ABQ9NLV0_9PEZI|nr:hypothetical protein H2201_006440 [Coniosporium apollinis]
MPSPGPPPPGSPATALSSCAIVAPTADKPGTPGDALAAQASTEESRISKQKAVLPCGSITNQNPAGSPLQLVKQLDIRLDKQQGKPPDKQPDFKEDPQEDLPVSTEPVLLPEWVEEEVVPAASRFTASRSMLSQLTDSQLTVIQVMDSQPMDSPATASKPMAKTSMANRFTALLSEGTGQAAHLAAVTLLKWAGEGRLEFTAG